MAVHGGGRSAQCVLHLPGRRQCKSGARMSQVLPAAVAQHRHLSTEDSSSRQECPHRTASAEQTTATA